MCGAPARAKSSAYPSKNDILGRMIPYEELCEALALWRGRNGLLNGPSAHPPQGVLAVASSVTTSPAGGGVAAFGGSAAAPATTEETFVTEPKTLITPNPLAADAGSDADWPTGLHHARAPQDNTNELDLENVLLVDEDDI